MSTTIVLQCREIQPRIAMVGWTLYRAMPDLIWICINILMILPILAVLLCLFETHHDDGFFTYRGLLASATTMAELC